MMISVRMGVTRTCRWKGLILPSTQLKSLKGKCGTQTGDLQIKFPSWGSGKSAIVNFHKAISLRMIANRKRTFMFCGLAFQTENPAKNASLATSTDVSTYFKAIWSFGSHLNAGIAIFTSDIMTKPQGPQLAGTSVSSLENLE